MKSKTKFNNVPNKPRKCATMLQVRELESTFERDPRPSHDKRLALANKLNMHPRTVQIWFQNRRAKARSQNHLMVKTVNCSAPLSQISTQQSMNYNFETKEINLPQIGEILLPYCLSPKANDYTMQNPIENPIQPNINFDNSYPFINFQQNSMNCNINQVNSFLTPPSISGTSPQQFTPYTNNMNGEMLDVWGVPYDINNHLIDMGILNPYISTSHWTGIPNNITSIPLRNGKLKDIYPGMNSWDTPSFNLQQTGNDFHLPPLYNQTHNS